MGDGCRFQPLIFQGVPVFTPEEMMKDLTNTWILLLGLKFGPRKTTKNRPFGAEIWHPNGGSRYVLISNRIATHQLEMNFEKQKGREPVFRLKKKPRIIRPNQKPPGMHHLGTISSYTKPSYEVSLAIASWVEFCFSFFWSGVMQLPIWANQTIQMCVW